VVGTLLMRFAIVTSVSVSVAMNLTRSHASASCSDPFGIPMMVPPAVPEPYASVLLGDVGSGAVSYRRSGTASAMNAFRHSPSICIATRPCWKSCGRTHSLPAPATNVCSLSAPVWKSPFPYTSAMNVRCHSNISAHAGSVA
jgi:hypothetical protein